ncbi:MAG: class I mannose-6-phosphate isomerase [Chloroflexota bacterium]|nr:mannose-6-phosphate isomerase [Chloroflexia bacterium]MDQ3227918.1 class I mannose-6-phosphate isomerase [Chloroflexota bacterium]
MEWSPIRMTYHVRTYRFGERLIPEMLGKQGVPDGVVAETWEISDQKDTRATITSGPFAGRLLHDVVAEHPDEIVGEGWRGPHFPILDKFLDASHLLPIHLHADDETARRVHGEPNGKTEAWHILHAAPDASILAGIRPGFSDDDLRQAFLAEDYDRVMFRYPIAAGDTVYVPGCILHAFGPDTLIYEVQQTSDLGQSVMPTDLLGNRLSDAQWRANIEATLGELKTNYLPRPNHGLDKPAREAGNQITVGCAGPYFALERWRLTEPHHDPAHPWRFLTLSNVGEPVTVAWSGGEETLGRAESLLLPAAIGDVTVTPSGANGDLVACYLPVLERDIIAPLRAAGHPDGAIAALGDVNFEHGG